MAESSIRKQRIPWIDLARAFTIFFVVLGHVMRQGYAWQIVYSFHVPAFFLLSGLTCHVSTSISGQLKRDIRSILVPYYLWGLISIVVFNLLGQVAMGALAVDSDSSIGGSLYGLLYASPRTRHMRFNLPLWFLPCLFATKALFYLLYTLCKGKKPFLLLDSTVLALCGFVYSHFRLPSLPFFLEVSCKLLPFFVLGYALGNSQQLANVSALPKRLHLFLGAGFLLVTAVVAVYAPKVNYTSDTFPNAPIFYSCALCGISGVILFSVAIRHASWMEFVGKQTLAILVMHKFPVVLFQILPPFRPLLATPDSISGVLGGMIITTLSIGLCLLAAQILVPMLPLLFGISKKRKSQKA